MKPSLLSAATNMPEVRNWMKNFKSYYTSSNMDLLSLLEQHTIFFGRMENNLAVTIRSKVVDGSTINDCYKALEARFLEIRPLYLRRRDWFVATKSPVESFSEWVVRLQALGNEAEIEKMSVDDWTMFQSILGSQGEDGLHSELMKVIEPKLSSIIVAAVGHESVLKAKASSEKICKVEVAQVIAVTNNCHRCGRPEHTKPENCFARDRMCHDCGKTGHLARMCRDPSSREPSADRSGARNSRERGRPAQRHSGSSLDRRRYSRSPSTAQIRVVATNKATPRMKLFCEIGNGLSRVVIPDTGASRSVFPTKSLPPNILLRPSSTRLIAANESLMRNSGSFEFYATTEDSPRVLISALISPDLQGEPLIGWRDLMALHILSPKFPSPIVMGRSAVSMDDEGGDDDDDDIPTDLVRGHEYFPTEAKMSQSIKGRKNLNHISDQICNLDGHWGASLELLVDKYKDVMCSSLGGASGTMVGPGMKITLDPLKKITPLHVYTARQVQFHFAEQSNFLVQELLDAGVIVKVEEPTRWCSPAHFVPKPGGKKVRMVADYRTLNKAVLRPVHPFYSARDLTRQVDKNSRYFIKLDAIHGYFQVPLDRESSFLTTFLLPSGKYRYTVAPMGLCSSGDEFCIRTDRAMAGLPWLMKIVDDLLVQAPTMKIALERYELVLKRCRDHGIKLSLEKMEMGTKIKFAGFIVSKDGISADPAKLQAIREFPIPKSVTELRSFLGLANQLGSFLPDLAHSTVKMRELLKKGNAFLWLDVHQAEFDLARRLLYSAAVVKPFDPSLRTELLTDASRLHGLGFALVQRELNGQPRLIQCGSCSLTPAMRNYATIELEATALMTAVLKCDFYLRGMSNFKVITDHLPLVGIFDKRSIIMDNDRLQRIRERLIMYDFEVTWSSGKEHQIADALSRAPFFPADDHMDTNIKRVDTYVNKILFVPNVPNVLVLFHFFQFSPLGWSPF